MSRRPASRGGWPIAAAGLATGVLLGGVIFSACWWAAGATLGLYLAPLAMAVAGIAAARGSAAWDASLAIGVVTAISAGWVIFGPVRMGTTLQAALLLAAWVAPLFTLAWALPGRGAVGVIGTVRTVGVVGVVVRMVVIVGAWLWLLWPIWLGPALAGAGARPPVWTMEIHPLLAMNAAVAELGYWTELPVAYRLSPLGQDIAPALPLSVLPAAGVHLAAGCLVAGAGWGWRAWAERRA